MGMLMYEDMKVSVLQLLSFGQKIFLTSGGISPLLPILISRGKETYCPWRKVV